MNEVMVARLDLYPCDAAAIRVALCRPSIGPASPPSMR